MTQRQTAVQFDPDRAADFELSGDVGNPYAPDGATRAVLVGTGEVRIEHRRADAGKPDGAEPTGEQVGTHRLGPDTVRKLLGEAASFNWDAKFPPRPGIPDEPVLTWTFADRRGGSLTVKVWLHDAERDERMAPVLAALRQAVDAATEGRHYL